MTDAINTSLTDAARLEQVAQIVAAYVSNNVVAVTDLGRLIADTHKTLQSLSAETDTQVPVEELKPAVPIKKSITPDFLICLDDGKKFKSLKRHITRLGMTPAEYRAKWGLPDNYPMVAPNYSSVRSALAKSSGLGQKAPVTSAKATKKKQT